MQYNKHNFKSKQVLTSQMMNEIDQGIADLVEHANSNDGKLNLTIGTVTSGSTAAATITDGKLNLTLPKGEKGDTGAKGDAGPRGDAGAKGDTGVTPVLTIGSVTTGDTANAIITGIAEAPELNLVLPKGAKGDKGDTGAAPNLTIGSVTTGDTANAIITGTAEAPILNLTLPKGQKGADGEKGDKGDTGATPNLSIGTVTGGTEAAATITGTAEAPVLNLTLPKGEKGDKGDPGSSGSSTGGVTDLTIGTVTSGSTASATIENGKLNLVLPKGDTGAKGEAGPKGDAGAKGDKGDTGDGMSETSKELLLSLLENAAYKTNTMQDILNALRIEWGRSAQDAPVQSVSLSAETLTMNEGDSKTLTATVLPTSATSRLVVWTVTPAGFATVSNGVVTGIKAGNCTVTATAGGKSASCAVTVEVAETAQLIYSLPGETVLTQGLDTGLKLLEHASTETPQYTILVDAKAGDDFNANTWPAFLHCLTETGDTDNLPGFNSTSSPLNNKTEFAYYNYGGVTLSDSIEHLKTRTRYAVQIDGRKYRGGSTYCPLTEWKTTNGTIIDVPQTFLIGAAQSADGSKKQQFWLGTLYQCRVYKGLLSDDKVNDYIEKGW
jgi:hypothetical protein